VEGGWWSQDLLVDIVRRALAEDVGRGDLTSNLLIPSQQRSGGRIVAKEEGILAGLPVAEEVFRQVDATVVWEPQGEDGQPLRPGQVVARVEGLTRALLTAERVALNFLQRLSGIATLTAAYVEAIRGTSACIVDTRKTTPGLRMLEKYAVRVGGGRNHRFGLDDGILIKDNHIVAVGSIREALRRAKEGAPHSVRIEVEVETLEQLEEALEAGADAVLLDNMPVDMLQEAVRRTAGRARLEASGGITLESVRAVAETGVDWISIGALTHSAPALDFSLELEREG